ncbi:hypothetical protein MmiEs2_09000 [Methanimicrococcus stummii]|uniref:Uncharacterized protein n=1 Tax=Methanimicrococcus stummii TaxID=3028294 RepID=A0AA96VM02_9EURY|nr:hypothetical protein [Methanimicrococcus sp. Es2]WNY28697.1 hypothetical protein MmiEs2_09000 [Methanimicrococcus sp. Es2]
MSTQLSHYLIERAAMKYGTVSSEEVMKIAGYTTKQGACAAMRSIATKRPETFDYNAGNNKKSENATLTFKEESTNAADNQNDGAAAN